MKRNPHNYHLFGPDETASNRLQVVYGVSKKYWMKVTSTPPWNWP
ncbi:hypothetical protein [Candidatus Synechococcus spongiarum]|uniref:Xylulose-5-phosphate phosphoketolase n=1 Tax=Candidatus Synechococcus spongiarum TaxID=431041 RepID=A0A171DGM6_9SYNE|nr:hypothetical protein [Candidatus Synechococcus spongiarum]SAY38868.1 Xylulose-5-phosphate phosphoketolase (EC 4.1.2.9); Fructose-6-phosphate phosphoketolase (EC 4.1.2.22) [Candidatus Synechococcus spongiarum]